MREQVNRDDFLYMVGRIDSTSPTFRPFWETCTREELAFRIKRLKRALPSCIGRAEWIRTNVEEHIEFLKQIGVERFGEKLQNVLSPRTDTGDSRPSIFGNDMVGRSEDVEPRSGSDGSCEENI